MLTIDLSAPSDGGAEVLALAVPSGGAAPELPGVPAAILEDHLARSGHTGAAGAVADLPRPTETPRRLLLVGIGAGDESGWRAAGVALVKAAAAEPELAVVLPERCDPPAVRGLAEGLLLARYRFRLGRARTDEPKLGRVVLITEQPDRFGEAVRAAEVVVSMTDLARDLTNMPSQEKTPHWFAQEVAAAATGPTGGELTTTIWDPDRLAAEGFGGILAVGGAAGSRAYADVGGALDRGPRLVQVTWRPPGAAWHVVLIGKGITFDTGGICIKPRDGMKLMRKDMGGAAAIIAATIGAARLGLPTQVTGIAALAENMVGADAWRPGDVVRHYGGRTTEVLNTDAEGRVVLADAIAYAVDRLRPDRIVDLATLTGANAVALGKRTAALYSDSDGLAGELTAAADAAGEHVWRMPLADDYLAGLSSDIADLANVSEEGGGSIVAALYLREFTGDIRSGWAHLDMSAPSWSDSADGELPKGATGWGVRTLLRWLETTASA